MFEMGMVHKPVFLYQKDYQDYCAGRGLYFSREELPFPNAQDNDKLIENIAAFDAEPYVVAVDKLFKEKLALLTAQHLSEETFSVDRLAELMKMGRTKFYGKVKELTGMSPNKLMVAERMRIAADMLEEGELNISEIAYKVGFPEASYFNKCFKQYYGMAPSKYRKEN
jgi:AraC-like DNA-binding protein